MCACSGDKMPDWVIVCVPVRVIRCQTQSGLYVCLFGYYDARHRVDCMWACSGATMPDTEWIVCEPVRVLRCHLELQQTLLLLLVWLLNFPAGCYCISGTDLLGQLYLPPRWDRSCRSHVLSHLVEVLWHRANQSWHWPYNVRHLTGQPQAYQFSSHWYDSTRKKLRGVRSSVCRFGSGHLTTKPPTRFSNEVFMLRASELSAARNWKLSERLGSHFGLLKTLNDTASCRSMLSRRKRRSEDKENKLIAWDDTRGSWEDTSPTNTNKKVKYISTVAKAAL